MNWRWQIIKWYVEATSQDWYVAEATGNRSLKYRLLDCRLIHWCIGKLCRLDQGRKGSRVKDKVIIEVEFDSFWHRVMFHVYAIKVKALLALIAPAFADDDCCTLQVNRYRFRIPRHMAGQLADMLRLEDNGE